MKRPPSLAAYLWPLTLTLGVMLTTLAPLAEALEVTISAQYRGGGSGRFENTTPPAKLCGHWSALCRQNSTVELPILYAKRSQQSAADLRDRYYLKLPAGRHIDVYHELTGEPRSMAFEFQSLSQKAESPNTSYSPLRGSFQDGCSNSASIAGSRSIVFHAMLNEPKAPQPCWASYRFAPATYVDNARITEMGVSYNLEIPPPYRLKAGLYRGSTTYTIGPGGDFDFGNGVTALTGDTLTINFVLDVQHAFLFEFAPGSDRAVLEPKGGWQAWISGGRSPQRIYRDLPFRLWSTGAFKVYKLCQHYAGAGCGIRDNANHEAPVEVGLSLPGGIEHQGRAVDHLPLPSGKAAALSFDSVIPALNRPGQLHFSVGATDVKDMLAHPGTTYNGLVTVVFDAEP